jgi:hypothetical protein
MTVVEVDTDTIRFPSANQLATWTGVAAGNQENLAKQRSRGPAKAITACRPAYCKRLTPASCERYPRECALPPVVYAALQEPGNITPGRGVLLGETG